MRKKLVVNIADSEGGFHPVTVTGEDKYIGDLFPQSVHGAVDSGRWEIVGDGRVYNLDQELPKGGILNLSLREITLPDYWVGRAEFQNLHGLSLICLPECGFDIMARLRDAGYNAVDTESQDRETFDGQLGAYIKRLEGSAYRGIVIVGRSGQGLYEHLTGVSREKYKIESFVDLNIYEGTSDEVCGRFLRDLSQRINGIAAK